MACASLGISPAASPGTSSRCVGLRRSQSEPLLLRTIRASQSPAAPPRLKNSRSIGSFSFGTVFTNSIRSLLFDQDREGSGDEMADYGSLNENRSAKRGNWVQKICEIRDRWKDHQATGNWEDYECGVSYESEDDEAADEEEWNRESFAKVLRSVPSTETKLFGHLAFLCNMAYLIPEIRSDELSKYYGLRLVTSSLNKKQKAAIKAQLDSDSNHRAQLRLETERASPSRPLRSSSVAYKIAANAASYIRSRAKSLLYMGSNNEPGTAVSQGQPCLTHNTKVATYVAASSVTAVVAAEEEARLAAARDLQSLHSCPCDWFVCDEPSTRTRCFVIQGSDSLASWQTNLFFEPTKFEDIPAALVHRGIYEASKGLYEQFLPEIRSHLLRHRHLSRFRFTGHSLGGSLALLISLMLLSRRVIPLFSLLPVVTFGSPAVFCGGHTALRALGLDDSHICSVLMHRDIVPRVLSCDYPCHVTRILKRLNRSFRSHPCLNADKLLYFPIGKQYILQPDETFSPPHPMLPVGAGLYELDFGVNGKSAIRAFLNAPHPLETLSNLGAYGSDGTILRDHESCNYLLAINGLLRLHTLSYVKRSKMNRLWPAFTCPTTARSTMPIHAWTRRTPTAVEAVEQVASRA